MRMLAAAIGFTSLLLIGCGGAEEAAVEEMEEPAAEVMEEAAPEEMAPDSVMMTEEGMPEEAGAEEDTGEGH